MPWVGSHNTSVHTCSSPVALKQGTLVTEGTPPGWAIEQPAERALPRGKENCSWSAAAAIPESALAHCKGRTLRGAAQSGRREMGKRKSRKPLYYPSALPPCPQSGAWAEILSQASTFHSEQHEGPRAVAPSYEPGGEREKG